MTAETSGGPIFSSQSAPASSGESEKRFFDSHAGSIASGGVSGAKRPSARLARAPPEVQDQDRRAEQQEEGHAQARARDAVRGLGRTRAGVGQGNLDDEPLMRRQRSGAKVSGTRSCGFQTGSSARDSAKASIGQSRSGNAKS